MSDPKARLALAIEDRVDLCFQGDENADIVHLTSRAIREDSDYFADIRDLVEDLLRELVTSQELEPAKLFDSVVSTVVSFSGVIDGNRATLQSARLYLPTPHGSRSDKKPAPLFDFPEELTSAAKKIIGKSWSGSAAKRFHATVYVVNDATAIAVYEYSLDPGHRANSVYVKCHGAINIGFVLPPVDDKVGVMDHPEAGHSFPLPHEFDYAAGFKGVCPAHGWCLRGMATPHAFTLRARDYPAFAAWKPALDALTMQGLTGRRLDNAFAQYVLAETPALSARRNLSVDLLAHYLGQVVYNLAVITSPAKIIVGGCMAVTAVLDGIRENVVTWAQGYPWRVYLTAKGIESYIVASAQTEGGESEAHGALLIARHKPKRQDQGETKSAIILEFPKKRDGKSKEKPTT